ncbi:hypothetical protein [Pelagibius sp.]|uniref:hypothetical protein n=1 Tax=Pelagibius sp. TaxID=1931238 RepID=UPI0026079297|nr:hypothetical protein [Pelagibius sp.]
MTRQRPSGDWSDGRSTLARSLVLVLVLLFLVPTPSVGQYGDNMIEIERPPPGEPLVIDVPANAVLVLPFDLHEVVVSVDPPDVLFGLEDGGLIVLKGLFAHLGTVRIATPSSETPKPLSLEDLIAPGAGDPGEPGAGSAVPPEQVPVESEPSVGPDEPLPPLAGLRHTGRDLLFAGEAERAGHPLYSYLLFAGASEGSREERERFKSAIAAFVRQVRSAEALERSGAARESINIFYAPMRPIFEDTKPESMRLHFAQRSEAEQLSLLLELYDHARAEVLMGHLRLSGNGPFIVSVLRPLSRDPVLGSEAFLVQDLSRVPPELVGLWVDEFKRQVVQEATEEPEHLRRLALSLRTQIAVLADAFAITKSAVAEMFEAPDAAGTGNN